MMMGYLYMVGSEEKMGITPDFAKAEQVRDAGGTADGLPWSRGGVGLLIPCLGRWFDERHRACLFGSFAASSPSPPL